MEKDNAVFINKIKETIYEYKKFQKHSVPLCAAENIISDFAKLPLNGDWQERYIMGNTYSYSLNDNFIGSDYLFPIYEEIHKICNSLFNCKFSDARTLSGMNCMTTLLMSITNLNDKIAILPSEWGGHASVKPVCERLGLKVYDLPYNIKNLEIDYSKANQLLNHENIDYILLAPSDIIHPFCIDKFDLSNRYLLYDISQLMGLIAGEQIINPLTISNNVVMFGGTHKTLPGPASGLIMTNNNDIHEQLEKRINPLYLRHTQMHQVVSLLFALIEFNEYGKEYSKKIIDTSNKLGKKIENKGFQLIKIRDKLYSETHQIFMKCDSDEMNLIYKNAILYGITLNKKEKKLFSITGIRLGTQEIARYNWNDEALDIIASIIEQLNSKNPNSTYINELKRKLPPKVINYTFSKTIIKELDDILHKD